MGERLWAVYEDFDHGRWMLILPTLAFTRREAIDRWAENRRGDGRAEYKRRRAAGEVRAFRVTVEIEENT